MARKLKSKLKLKTQAQKQCGGTYKPAEYHGGNSGRYTASPSGLATGAYGEQAAVSQGVIRGDVAGPNLSWSGGNMMTGGSANNARNQQAGGSANNARNQQAGGSANNARNQQAGGSYKPAEYHGGNSGRYTASPSGLATGAYGEQAAVSQGVIRGDVAGPNLSWSGGNMMTGGSANNARNQQADGSANNARNQQACGRRKRGTRKHQKTGRKTLKQKAGCGCNGSSNRKGW
jgi:hypothetical protein